MFSGERSSSSTKPLIDVSGLRSSCEAVATNSLLARSSRARSLMSRTVHTTPSDSLPERAAVTARVAVVVLDHGLPAQRLVDSDGSGTVVVVDVVADHQLRQELGDARVDGGDLRRARLGDDQRVPEALDRDCEPSPLSSSCGVGADQVVAHGVERRAEVLQLPRACRLHARLERACDQASGGAFTSASSGAASPRTSHGDQGERADQREQAGDRHEESARRGGLALGTGPGLADQLARLELIGQRTRLGKRGPRAVATGESARSPPVARACVSAAIWSYARGACCGILRASRHDIPCCGGERGGSLAAGSRGARPAGVAEHLFLGDPGAGEVRGRGRQRCTVGRACPRSADASGRGSIRPWPRPPRARRSGRRAPGGANGQSIGAAFQRRAYIRAHRERPGAGGDLSTILG